MRDPLGGLRRAYDELGSISVLDPEPHRVRGRWTAVAFGPELNRQVFSDSDSFRTTGQGLTGPRGSTRRRIRYGLTRMQGERYRRQRELLLPAFQKHAVDGYCPAFARSTEAAVASWRPGQRIDLAAAMRGLALQLSCDVLFPRRDPAQSYQQAELVGRYLELSCSPRAMLLPISVPGTPLWQLSQLAERIQAMVLESIAEKRAHPVTPDSDLLATLVRACDDGDPLVAPDDLIGQAVILFGASYETMANSMTWAMFLLEQHPEVLADVQAELDSVLGDGPPTPDQLARLRLLENVVKETLRVLPPVPMTLRVITNPVQLGPFEMRYGDRVLCSHFVTHHMPELYPEPERFLPARWDSIRPSQYEYLPFSAGPRTCLGYGYAMTAMKVMLASVLRRYRLELVPGTQVDPKIRVTMGPAGGLPATVRERTPPTGAVEITGGIRELVELPGSVLSAATELVGAGA